MSVTALDLLEQLRGALDDVDPLLAGRVVDIEMARLRVLADPGVFRAELASLVESVVANTDATQSITVRVSRTGSQVRIDVFGEHDGTPPDATFASMAVPVAPGSTSADG
jgi:hypothetical protein